MAEILQDDTSKKPFGLSEHDLDHLRRERRRMLDVVVRTPEGRSLIKNACPDLDRLGRALTDEVSQLGKIARRNADDQVAANPLKEKAAAILLNDLMYQGHLEQADDLYAHRSKKYLRAQRVQSWMDRMIRQDLNKKAHWPEAVARVWGWGAHSFTILAALTLILYSSSYSQAVADFYSNDLGRLIPSWFGWQPTRLSNYAWYGFAATLISVRIIGTAIVWAIASFPSDDSPDKPVLDTDPRVGVLGHGVDLLLFTSFAAAIMVREIHPMTGIMVFLAGVIMILGTLFRITASGSGYPVPRLHLERMVRGGSTFLALLLASISAVPWYWSSVVLITLPTVFAWIEGQEAWRAMNLRSADPFDPITPPRALVEPTPEVANQQV